MSEYISIGIGLIILGLMLYGSGYIILKIFRFIFGIKEKRKPDYPILTKEQLIQRDNENRAIVKEQIERPFDNKPDGIPFFLIFDVESTDLVPQYIDPKKYEHYPFPVQLAWSVFTYEGELIKERRYIIKQEIEIPIESTKIHRISTQIMNEKGVNPLSVYDEFSNDLKTVKYMVAHNMEFDFKIMKAEYYRKGLKVSPLSRKKICTMKKTKDYCMIPFSSGRGGYKFPKLSELAVCTFAPNLEPNRFSLKGLHDAGMDVRVTAKCFFDLLHAQQYFDIPKE